jgi:hypothetical protein
MTDRQPIEPSAIFARDGTLIPDPRGRSARAASQEMLPALVRAAGAGPLLAASAFAVTAMAAVQAAEMAGWMAWQVAQGAFGRSQGRRPRGRGLEVTWTYVEIRRPF